MEQKTYDIVGLDAKYFNYIKGVSSSVCEYYNYNFIKTSNIIESYIKNKMNEEEKQPTKLYYFNDEKLNMGVEVLSSDSDIQISEAISLGYRILEEMGIDITLYIGTKNRNELDGIAEYLNVLDVDYEIDSKITNDNDIISFEFRNEEDILGIGQIREINNIKSIGWVIYLDKIITILKELNKDKEITNFLDVFVIGESLEERLNAARIVQDLRWSEIKSEVDTMNRNVDEQLKYAKSLNTRILIILNNEDLKHGIITVKDNFTQEEIKIDESEILDYIISNL